MTIPVIVAVVLALIAIVLFVLRRRRSASAGDKLTALVFLMSQPRLLSEQQVRDAIARAWGVQLGSEMQQGGAWLVDGGEVNPAMAQPGVKNYLVSANGHMFLVNSVSKPYMDNPEQPAESIPDMRLRRVIASHTAWNSVDLFGESPTEIERPEIYAMLGKLLAEFAGDDCIGLYCPEIDRCNEYAPAVLDALRAGQPLSIFEGPTFAPVVQVAGDDPRMVAAVGEARRRWPEFVAAFQKRGSATEQIFVVKARFAEGDNEEFMWVTPQTIDNGAVTGRLENTPNALTSIKEGDTVTVRVDDLNDWLYGGEKQQVGGFTMKVMTDVAKG